MAQDLGADIIDINMGCPARQVTGGLSGSALMRDLDHAMTLIEATVAAAQRAGHAQDAAGLGPRHASMRRNWRAAPKRRALRMVTVHGRTRCQFYGGKADWSAIARVREAISIPLIANGDGATLQDAADMLRALRRGRHHDRPRRLWPALVAGRHCRRPRSRQRHCRTRTCRGSARSSPPSRCDPRPPRRHMATASPASIWAGRSSGCAERGLLTRRERASTGASACCETDDNAAVAAACANSTRNRQSRRRRRERVHARPETGQSRSAARQAR